MQSTIKFIPIDYDYFDYEGRNYAKIVGRSDDGKRVCLIDSCDVYFWAIVNEGVSEKKIDQIRKRIDKIVVNGKVRQSRVLKTEVHDKSYLGKEYRKNGYELPFPLDGIRIEEVRCLLEGAILNRDVVEEHRAGIVSNYSTVVDRRMSDIESEGLPDEYS